MAKASRDKGVRGELEVAALFQGAGYDCARTPNSGGLRLKGDLYGEKMPFYVEVKRTERWDVPAWIRQASSEAPQGVPPLVCARRNNGEWYAILPLTDLLAALA